MQIKDLGPIEAERLSQWLGHALELLPEKRSAWLAELAREHGSIAQLVRDLLEAHDRAQTSKLLEQPLIAVANAIVCRGDAEFFRGALVGPYRLVQEIGYGGMAVVWLAERADGAFTRRVALKLPQRLRFRRDLAERFSRERDILARLKHPNIALLYDAGIAADSQAYLALEYVDGSSITSYCNTHRLSIAGRLKLFLQVLDAVQFAHANLVIHRDLKPTNILVSDDGQVHLLDFGIAKLLHDAADTTAESQLTRFGGRVLTLDFASPEQISGDVLTTATDIYSLGVVLYDLLVGKQPYRLKVKSAAQLEQAIIAAEWLPPSRAVSEDRPPYVGVRSLRSLKSLLAGDLDAVVSKAMDRSPRQRYGTAEAFRQDLQRHLDGVPVEARSPSRALIAVRFLRKHAAVSALVASLIVALSTATLAAIYNAHDERAQRQRADTTRDFLRDLFSQDSPEKTDGAHLTAVQLLARGGNRLDTEFKGDPGTKAVLLTEIGNVYLSLGLHDEARPYANRAIDLLEPMRNQFPLDYLAASDLLAEVLSESDEWSETIALADRTIPFARANPKSHDAWSGRFLGHRAVAERQLGALDKSEQDTLQALAEMKDSGAENTEYYVNTLSDLGGLYLDQGNDRRALETFLQFASRIQNVDTAHKANYLVGQYKVALAYNHLGEIAVSTRILEPLIPQFDTLVGAYYDRTIKARNLLAQNYAIEGELDKAMAVVDVNISALTQQPTGDVEGLRTSELFEAQFALYAHRLDIALPLARSSVAYMEQKYAGPKPLKLRARWILGEILVQEGQCREARPILQAALIETRANMRGKAHPAISEILDSLGRCSMVEGDLVEAKSLLTQALEINVAALGVGKPATLRSQIHLAWVDGLISGDAATAARLVQKRSALVAELGSENHPVVLQFDLLTDTLGAAQGGQRIAPSRRDDAENRLKALAGSSTVPLFVGLNSLT
jgi:eukaryotic-like serine/threonine-protein kinase